jgi:thiol-disulfide isomerase/thioredoxin
MTVRIALPVLLLTAVTALCPEFRAQQASTSSSAADAPVSFDPSRDASADIHAAILDAQRTNRRVLIDVGGEWCPYCLELASLFRNNRELLDLRDQNFIVVPLYYAPNQKNDKALASYPPIQGIPHFYILDKQGRFLHSQHVAELREDGAYSPAKMKVFLEKWSAPSVTASKQRSPAASEPTTIP